MWEYKPGDKVNRKQLQLKYGGRTQGGIGPSARSANVFIFSDPAVGEQYGYFDGWKADGNFHYTGEGQYGDQVMKSGNLSIRNHAGEGRALRLFYGARGDVEYAGQFEYVTHYETDAPEANNGPTRKVIVFVLRALGDHVREPGTESILPDGPVDQARVDVVAIEDSSTEQAVVNPSREPHTADKVEADLVKRFADQCRRRGVMARRLRIIPPGESKPIFSDVLLDAPSTLVEAKGGATREHVRMALGQLLDYGRFAPDAARVVLLPSKPRADLMALIESAGASAVWEESGQFLTEGGSFLA